MHPYLTAESYAKFLALQGYRVRRTKTTFWFEANRWFYLAAPHHREYYISPGEVRELFRGWRCVGVRYAAPLHSEVGKLSYQIVLDTRDYGLEGLSANVRSKIRRGLRRCHVGPADLGTLEREGWELNLETLRRQNRGDAWTEQHWRRFWRAAQQVPGVEGWGAWVGDKLAAFLVTVSFEDAVEFLLSRSTTDERGAYPNNALLFRVAEEMLVRRQAPQITFGLESLEDVKPLDEFKFSMGFRARPLRQVVVFHPVLRSILSRPEWRTLVRRWLVRRGHASVFWRKAAGLLQFAEESGL
ncbi:MAG: hypothetical protein KatS3mg077_1036 [Candidatus Binatia bacterium]|nr:MAG: hypothetical protein KatS3mg077_1036 [Candidatus Binatia bacterium]